MAILKTILDTSSYGEIIKQKKDILLKESIDKRKNIVIFGNEVIRKELAETPKEIPDYIIEEKQKLKRRLLELYEFLVKDHNLPITGLIEFLAKKYLDICKEIPKVKKDKLKKDFIIVACASFHGLDIVVSEDNRSMMSDQALKAFTKINKKEALRTPKFIHLKEFERMLKL